MNEKSKFLGLIMLLIILSLVIMVYLSVRSDYYISDGYNIKVIPQDNGAELNCTGGYWVVESKNETYQFLPHFDSELGDPEKFGSPPGFELEKFR